MNKKYESPEVEIDSFNLPSSMVSTSGGWEGEEGEF
jgi:hypothetical protein